MDLATVDKLLTTTRSVRKRLDGTPPVASEIIQTCLDIAIQAPTRGNIPRYHFRFALATTFCLLTSSASACHTSAARTAW